MGIMGFSWDSIGIRIMGWNGYRGIFSHGDMMEICFTYLRAQESVQIDGYNSV